MELQVGVKIIIKNRVGEILLTRRTGKYGHLSGQWDIVGGRIIPGTPLLENIKREILEEIGVNYTGSPELIYAQDILMPDRHVVRLTFEDNQPRDLKIKLDENEGSEFGWFSLKEINKIATKDLDRFFMELLKEELLR